MDRCQPPVGMPQGFYVYPHYQRGSFKRILVPGWWKPFGTPTPNLVLYDWATAAAKLLAGNIEYKIGGMYFEFQNMADPDDAVSAPSYGRDGGITYYDALSGSVDTDYIRVPLLSTVVTSSDDTRYPGGNITTTYAQTAGTTGTHGLDFNDSVNSKVFGGALVAMPDPNDASADLIISRFYFPAEKQMVKLAGSQIGLAWPLTQQ